MDGKFVAYYRVSTQKQGKSGLGLDGQRQAVESFLNGGNWKLVGEFTEVESGKRDDRPELTRAMHQARLTGATLLVAKLDRLSRDAAFLLNLSKSGIEVRACDMPDANTMMFGVMALVAQHERELISKRTKDALAAAKVRGTPLGGYKGGPVVDGRLVQRFREADHFGWRFPERLMPCTLTPIRIGWRHGSWRRGGGRLNWRWQLRTWRS
jgi:DNA invertase Pin-like site-specific DNA recombinase